MILPVRGAISSASKYRITAYVVAFRTLRINKIKRGYAEKQTVMKMMILTLQC